MVERIERIEKKLDDLAASVNQRFDEVGRRFDEVNGRFDAVGAEFNSVTGALVEQRQYTEFAFGRLETKMDAGFAAMESRFTGMDARFDRLERTVGLFIKSFGAPKRGPRRR